MVDTTTATPTDSTLTLMLATSLHLWEETASSSPLTSLAFVRLSATLVTFFEHIDALVQYAIDRNQRYSSLVTLQLMIDLSNPENWNVIIPGEDMESARRKEKEKEYSVMIKWAIGAMSIDLTRQEKSSLAERYPATFGREGSSSQWAT